jgi:GTPase SAR1 family protein
MLEGGSASHTREQYGPWSPSQVRTATSWPTRRDQPVNVALSPTADHLALSIGQQLNVCPVSGLSLGEPAARLSCALTPGLTWSPAGDKLAFRDEDGRCRLLDLSRVDARPGGEAIMELGGGSAMAFAPDSDRLVTLTPSLPGRMALTLFGTDRKAVWERVLTRNRMSSNRAEGVKLAWSPDGTRLACSTGTPLIWLIDAADGHVITQFPIHTKTVTGLSWMDDERIVSASEDATMQLWRPDSVTPPTVVETIPAAGMIFIREEGTALIWSASGELFAWSMTDDPVQLWDRQPPKRSVAAHFTRLSLSAAPGLLSLVDAGSIELILIKDWNHTASTPARTTTYANAKVLLLGDSGVGKSGLAMVLAGKEFQATESTHGRRIWRLPATEEADASGGDREVMIWDLAGQPGYRIVHQLHLDGAALALIVFDSKNETAPLLGVRHWARAVRHAHPITSGGLPAFLVAARIDRGGSSVSAERIKQVMQEFSIDQIFQTSAREGTGTDELRSRIFGKLDWEQIPKITSTALFAAMKQFVVDQKSSGNLLTPLNDLCQDFQSTVPSGKQMLDDEQAIFGDSPEPPPTGLSAVFEGCVARLESAGAVKRLKFGELILLQPELLDAYASAIVNAARDEPDGLGSITESRVIDLKFHVPVAERVPNHQQERLLVLATLEELIQHELVLREPTGDDSAQLVFPSAYRRDLPAYEAPKGDGVVFRFEGPIDNVYATLIVRLTRSDRFKRIDIWQSAARFAAESGECTICLTSDGEGKGELRIGYNAVPPMLRVQFESFVHTHLIRWATNDTVTRERQFCCPDDKTGFTSEQVEQRRKRAYDTILCPVCETRVSLRDEYETTTGTDHVTAAMDASADRGRDFEAASTVMRGKEAVAEFDVFLCHNWVDKPAVRELARQLRERGVRPWLDEQELRPGLPFQSLIEQQIVNIPAAAVIVGSQVGPWQDQELRAFLNEFVRRGCPVIPVLLPGCTGITEIPMFLKSMTWVDLGREHPDPLDQLVWGITGRHPGDQ